jgi:hypothetical protein
MIVISDMMGTLTTGSPILGLLDWIKVHQSKGQARWLLAFMWCLGNLLLEIDVLRVLCELDVRENAIFQNCLYDP